MRFAAAAVAVLLSTAALAEEPAPRPLASEGGRYVMGQVPGSLSRNAYILDTKTGRVWMLIEPGVADAPAMVPVLYVGPDAKKSLEPR